MSNETTLHPRTQVLLDKLALREIAPEDTLIDMLSGQTKTMHPVLVAIADIYNRRQGATPTAKQWETLAKLAKRYQKDWGEPLPPSLVATVARDLMPYVYPKLASAQVSAQVEAKLTIVPAISLTLSVIQGMEGADQTIHPYDGSLEKVH